MLTEFTRYYLAGFFTFVACFYTIRIVYLDKTSGQKCVHPGEKFTCSWFNHMLFRVFRIVIWGVCVVLVVYPQFDTYLGLLPSFGHPAVIISGNLLLTLGFVFTLIGHGTLGDAWRSGMDQTGTNKLITNGLYRYSRHPMYLAIGLAQLGFFLALPSIFTLTCLFFGWFTLYRQAALEEAFLLSRFKNEYQQYQTHVRRWI